MEGPPDPVSAAVVRLDLSLRVVFTSPSPRLHGPRRRQRSTRRDTCDCCSDSTPSCLTPRRPDRLTIRPRTPTVVDDLPLTLPTRALELPGDDVSSEGVGSRRRRDWGLRVSPPRPPSPSSRVDTKVRTLMSRGPSTTPGTLRLLSSGPTTIAVSRPDYHASLVGPRSHPRGPRYERSDGLPSSAYCHRTSRVSRRADSSRPSREPAGVPCHGRYPVPVACTVTYPHRSPRSPGRTLPGPDRMGVGDVSMGVFWDPPIPRRP